MDISKPCYLFFDLDGTVLGHDGKLSEETLAAMLRAQKLGHKLILNTGRSQGGYMLKKVEAAHAIPWDGKCFSASDIFFEGELIYENRVSWEDFSAWLEYSMERRMGFYYCGRRSTFIWDFSKYNSAITEAEKDEWRATAKAEFESNILTNISVVGVLDQGALPKSGLCICQLPTYADLFPAGCNKGEIVRIFCEKTGADLEQCAGFGDSNNDVDMLRVCPTGVCMKNSPQSLIDVATYHAKTENGVAEGLNALFGV